MLHWKRNITFFIFILLACLIRAQIHDQRKKIYLSISQTENYNEQLKTVESS